MAAKKSEAAARRPASTPLQREQQLIALATDEAERQMREGTASAQVISHFLKMGSEREQLERQKMAYETELLKARTDNLTNVGRMEELTEKALKAFRQYSGQDFGDEDD